MAHGTLPVFCDIPVAWHFKGGKRMQFYPVVSQLLGLDLEPKDLTLVQVCLRAILVFVATLIIVRLAEKRFLARLNALDAILGFVLASMLARAINGSGPFFATLAGGLLLVLLQRAMVNAACRWERFGDLVKGKEEVLIENGQLHQQVLHRNHLSEKDLAEELRLNGNIETLGHVKKAVIERSGEISIVKRE
jgi:uncharacterized membrane protein YcaP (DUF421 family)